MVTLKHPDSDKTVEVDNPIQVSAFVNMGFVVIKEDGAKRKDPTAKELKELLTKKGK